MQVGGAIGELKFVQTGNTRRDLASTVGSNIHIADQLRFLDGLGCPGTRIGVISRLPLTEQIDRDVGKLGAGAAL